ncbi:hypothetical protein BH09SUM1_BH09SUM1_01140 [soil metagenome]
MLTNFHIAALLRIERQDQLLRLPMHVSLQETLASEWEAQLATFLHEVEEIPFAPAYTPEEHEKFVLTEFTLDPPLGGVDSGTIVNKPSLMNARDHLEKIRSIIAFCRQDDRELVLFQNFFRGRVVRPGGFMLMGNDTFSELTTPGFALDRKLAAVYYPHQRKLLFSSFRTVNTFFDLAQFYREATQDEIHEILQHAIFAAEDGANIAELTGQWFAKSFAMLRDSRLLDNHSAPQLKLIADGLEIAIQVTQDNGTDQIVFPADRKQARVLLKFLNQQVFRSAITRDVKETNSYRDLER